jgi:HEAT repeat protein
MAKPQRFFVISISFAVIIASAMLAGICSASDLGKTLYSLGEQRATESYVILVASLKHPDPHIRRIAAHALGKLGNKDALPHLVKLASDDRQPAMVRRVALKSLEKLGALMAGLNLERSSQQSRSYSAVDPSTQRKASGRLNTVKAASR